MSKYIWVAGRYKGPQAKSVADHAHAGIGYFDLEDMGTKSNPECIAYFVYLTDNGALPEHLLEVKDRTKIAKLERQRNDRMNSNQPKKAKPVQSINNLFPAKVR